MAPLDPLALTPFALALAGGLWALGFVFARRWPLNRALIVCVLLAVGLALRALAFALPPYLEIDFYRYFWDAKQLLNGFNPYEHPVRNLLFPIPEALKVLQAQEADVVRHIRSDTLAFSTIYSPVSIGLFAGLNALPGPTELGFALSFLLSEALALLILWRAGSQRDGRLGLWALALNPLAILVSYNGLHFDLWLLPLLLGWVFALRAGRPGLALALLILAIGLRHWAVLLLPLTIMAFTTWPRRMALSGLSLGLIFLLFLPQLWFAGAPHSGLQVYGQHWEMNDALFLLLKALFGDAEARLLALGLPIAIACLWALLRPKTDPALYGLLLVGLLLLLSPTFFPWYWLWLLPFLILAHSPLRIAFAALAAALPFYYLRFWFEERMREAIYDEALIWLIFGPIFILLLIGTARHVSYPNHPRPE